MRRVVIILALVGIAGGLAWFALPDGGSPAPKPPRSGDLTRAPSSQVPARDPAGEPRDDAWAQATEAELRQRFQRIRGAKLAATECHETQCEVTVAGSAADVGKTIADLEGDRGLHGYADTVRLTPPAKRPDGTVVLRVIVSFRR